MITLDTHVGTRAMVMIQERAWAEVKEGWLALVRMKWAAGQPSKVYAGHAHGHQGRRIDLWVARGELCMETMVRTM